MEIEESPGSNSSLTQVDTDNRATNMISIYSWSLLAIVASVVVIFMAYVNVDDVKEATYYSLVSLGLALFGVLLPSLRKVRFTEAFLGYCGISLSVSALVLSAFMFVSLFVFYTVIFTAAIFAVIAVILNIITLALPNQKLKKPVFFWLVLMLLLCGISYVLYLMGKSW